MARRRKLGNLAFGASQGVNDVAMLLLQNKLLSGRQQDQRENMTLQSVLTNLLTQKGKVATDVTSGSKTPDQAAAEIRLLEADLPDFLRGRLDFSADYAPLAPSRAKRLQPLGESIDTAASPSAVPTREGIRRRALAAGASPDVTKTGLLPNTSDDPTVLPSRSYQSRTTESPDIAALIAEATGKREDLKRSLTREAVGDVDEQGNKITKFLTEEEQGGLTTRGERTPEEEARFAIRGQQASNVGGLPELRGEAGRRETLSGTLSPEVTNAEVSKAARTAGAQEQERLTTYFQPQFIKGRMDELVAKAAEELRVTGEKDKQGILLEQGRAVAQIAPGLQRVAALADRLNTKEGFGARATGWAQRGAGAAGMNPDVTQLQSELSKLTRPLAVMVLGVREANVSNTEQQMVADGLGIRVGGTRTETVQALRNLRSASFVGLEATKRLPYNASPQDRINTVNQLIKQQQAAEDEAVKSFLALSDADKAKVGQVPTFLDPVTGSVMPIIFP